MVQGIRIDIVGDNSGVEEMMKVIDTSLSAVALAGFMSGVVGPYLQSRAADRFEGEGDDVVGAWAPLASVTVDIRANQGYGGAHPINRRTDELRDYIVNGPMATPSLPGVGTDLIMPGKPPQGELVDKLVHAQRGGVSDSGKEFPARPVLGMNERDLAFVLLALATHVEKTGSAMGMSTS